MKNKQVNKRYSKGHHDNVLNFEKG